MEFVKAEVDPGFEDVTKTNEETGQNDLSTSVRSGRSLGQPHRDDRAQLSYTSTKNDTADNKLSKSERGGFQDGSDEGEYGSYCSCQRMKAQRPREEPTNKDDIAATERITGPGAGQGTKEGTNDENRDDHALNGTVVALFGSLGVDGIELGEGLHPVGLG